jgi:hypothetical protein
MRFMKINKGSETAGPPPPALMAAFTELIQKASKTGELVQNGGLLPSAQGAKIKLSGGQLDVIDGPFTESKEIIGGFAIYEVESKEKAVALAMESMKLFQEHWPGWEGECEIRPMFDMPGKK